MEADDSTYWKRFRDLWGILSPFNLLTPPSKLEELKNKPVLSTKEEYIVKSMVHPETGETIFLPFRMAAVVPTNLALVLGMLTARTPGSIIFWQWLNQSLNVAVNHANANKSTPLSMQELLLGYTTAVASSCSVAIAFNHLAQKRGSALLRGTAPVLATALAGVLNVLMVRRKELEHGIAIYDTDGKMLGHSKEAAHLALSQVSMTRVLTAVTVLTIPQLIMRRIPPLAKYRIPIQMAVIGATLQMALPTSLAVFPQKCRFYSKEHGCTAFYNKGY